MFSQQEPITVLRQFDGFNIDVIEIIHRKVQTGGRRTRKGQLQIPRKTLSYKGKVCDVFLLNAKIYNLKYRNCISITE